MECNCIIGNINFISNISDKFLDDKIKKDGLPILRTHIKLFFILPYSRQPMLFNEVWRTWGISKSSLSDIVLKYVKLGLIERKDCPEDKRTIYLNLTEKAYPIIDKLSKYEDEFTNILLEGFCKDKYIFKDNIYKALKNAEKYLSL